MTHVMMFIDESVDQWRVSFDAINETADPFRDPSHVLSKDERRTLAIPVYDLMNSIRSRRKEIERLIEMQSEYATELQRSLILVYTESSRIDKALNGMQREFELSRSDCLL